MGLSLAGPGLGTVVDIVVTLAHAPSRTKMGVEEETSSQSDAGGVGGGLLQRPRLMLGRRLESAVWIATVLMQGCVDEVFWK